MNKLNEDFMRLWKRNPINGALVNVVESALNMPDKDDAMRCIIQAVLEREAVLSGERRRVQNSPRNITLIGRKLESLGFKRGKK